MLSGATVVVFVYTVEVFLIFNDYEHFDTNMLLKLKGGCC